MWEVVCECVSCASYGSKIQLLITDTLVTKKHEDIFINFLTCTLPTPLLNFGRINQHIR